MLKQGAKLQTILLSLGGSSLLRAALLFSLASAASGAEISADPDNYLLRLMRLSPGDTLKLAPGVYRKGLPIHQLNGEPGRVITIRGPEGVARAILMANTNRNTISIVDSSYILISHLHLDGQALPVDAVKAEGHAQWAHHITLEDLIIRQHGHDQQTVAISTKCPAWGWVVRRNVIEGAGTGMYFGNSDGRAPFIAGLIEYNLIVDTLGYNVQIKHQQPRPDLPGMPHEKSVTIIRHNVFSKANGGSKELARPNLLVGHWPLSGPGVDDEYLIYGNFFYQNPYEALFQGEGNLALYNNLFFNTLGDAVAIQPHHDEPRKIAVFFNTIIASGAGMRLVRRETTPSEMHYVAGNLVFAQTPFNINEPAQNFTRGFSAAAKYLARPFAPLGQMDLSPVRKIPAPKIDVSRQREYSAADQDFDGNARGSLLGAYAGIAAWRPQLSIKPIPPSRESAAMKERSLGK